MRCSHPHAPTTVTLEGRVVRHVVSRFSSVGCSVRDYDTPRATMPLPTATGTDRQTASARVENSTSMPGSRGEVKALPGCAMGGFRLRPVIGMTREGCPNPAPASRPSSWHSLQQAQDTLHQEQAGFPEFRQSRQTRFQATLKATRTAPGACSRRRSTHAKEASGWKKPGST
jgi:hypothetical protein